jgi:isopentenyldiphosphate isomerase
MAIAFFVTAHGFGHAARSIAVMNAIFHRWPFARFEIFAQVPEWFFKKSLHAPFDWHPVQADVGLVRTPILRFDLNQILAALEDFPPFDIAPNCAEAAAEYICRTLTRENELLDIVDAQGCIIGAAPRKCAHGDNRLLHRVVHVLVFDAKNRLLLQKRSMAKRVAPGRWDTSVGGHVDCGESIETAMLREMREELGICPDSPRFAYQYIHANEFESEFVFTYVCQFDGQITWNQAEIDAVKFWEFEEIDRALGKEILSDNFEDEFKRYRKWVETCASRETQT